VYQHNHQPPFSNNGHIVKNGWPSHLPPHHTPTILLFARVTTIYEHCKAFLSEIFTFLFPGLSTQKGGVQSLYTKLDMGLHRHKGHHWGGIRRAGRILVYRLRSFSSHNCFPSSVLDVSRSSTWVIVDHLPAIFRSFGYGRDIVLKLRAWFSTAGFRKPSRAWGIVHQIVLAKRKAGEVFGTNGRC